MKDDYSPGTYLVITDDGGTASVYATTPGHAALQWAQALGGPSACAGRAPRARTRWEALRFTDGYPVALGSPFTVRRVGK